MICLFYFILYFIFFMFISSFFFITFLPPDFLHTCILSFYLLLLFFPFFLFFSLTSCTIFPTNKPRHPQCRRIILEYEGALYQVEVEVTDCFVTLRSVVREFRHREVSLPPRHFGFRTSGAPSRWGGILRTFTIDGESV